MTRHNTVGLLTIGFIAGVLVYSLLLWIGGSGNNPKPSPAVTYTITVNRPEDVKPVLKALKDGQLPESPWAKGPVK
jgi:hypothetical protein